MIKFKGFKGTGRLVKAIDDYDRRVLNVLLDEFERTAISITGRTKQLISRPYPEGAVDTGILKNSYTYQKREMPNGFRFRIGTNVHYAPPVEYGTRPHFPPLGDETKGLVFWALRHMRSRPGARPVFERPKGKDAELKRARSIAFLVARKISKVGTHPRPHLRPAFIEGKRALANRLGSIFR